MSSLAVLPAWEAPASDLEGRIIDAALGCVGRWGLAKTTLDDVARQAMCSRATIYRAFPGGKVSLLQAMARAEVVRVCLAVDASLAEATSLAEALTGAIVELARQIADHQPLRYLLAHEPEAVVPWLAFGQGEQLLAFAASFAAPRLARWLEPAAAAQAGEWAARLVLSFCSCPSPGVDLTDPPAVARLVTTFMLPGLSPGR